MVAATAPSSFCMEPVSYNSSTKMHDGVLCASSPEEAVYTHEDVKSLSKQNETALTFVERATAAAVFTKRIGWLMLLSR